VFDGDDITYFRESELPREGAPIERLPFHPVGHEQRQMPEIVCS
jgi:hypothetical protein